MQIGIIGGEGRMGQAIAALAAEQGVTIAGATDKDGDPIVLAKAADVLIDF